MKRSGLFIAGLAAILLSPVWGDCAQAPGPATSESRNPPASSSRPRDGVSEVIILNNGSDVGDFLKRLKQPDLILIKPDVSGNSPASADTTTATPRPPEYVVRAVKIRGRVHDDLADLRLEIELTRMTPGDVWVPLGIDAPIIDSAREGAKDLELRTSERGQWEVRLGGGDHHLLLELKVPVNASRDQKQMALAIPEAPTTFFELEVPRAVRELDIASGGSVTRTAIAGGPATRLSAHLSPRSRLALEWTDEASAATPPPPVLAAQVEIDIEPDLEAVALHSSWVIRCTRGIARKIEIRLDEQDIVQVLRLDNQFLVAPIERNVLTIPLNKPMEAGEMHRLQLDTRRVFPPASPKSYTFSGLPLENAAEQTGAIAIAQPANLWINVTATQGLRRIDPRELPADLRTRPGTGMAYQFGDQPCKLGLSIESYSPLYRCEASTRMTLEADMAHVDTTLQIQRVRGRLFDLEVWIPPGLQLISVGPDDLVESAVPVQPAGGGNRAQPTPQVLKIQLTEQGRDLKSFALRLRGQQRIATEGAVKLGLFATRDGVSASSTVSLIASSEVSFELENDPAQPGNANAFTFQIPARSEASAGRPKAAPVDRSAVFRSHQNPFWLNGRLTRHPLTITHDARITARVARHSIEVQQDCELRVRHGTISSLIVGVPFPRTQAWQVQSKVTIKREELDQKAGDSRRYRLVFDPPIQESAVLTFRYQVPVELAVPGSDHVKASFPWIHVEEGTVGSTTVELAAAPGILTAVDDPTWVRFSAEEGEPVATAQRPLYRPANAATASQSFAFSAWALEQVVLPSMVVPRVLLRTVIGVDHELKTRAWYWIESHPASIVFTLPDRARWIRAHVDGRLAEQVEHEPSSGSYRLILPPDAQTKPVLVELEYELAGPAAGKSCVPPELPANAAVLQTFWEVQVPWSQAIIGVPWGWSDENVWQWDYYVWKRRPWKPFSRLVAWVAGSPAQAGTGDDVVADEQDSSHSYLFGRSSKPEPLSPWLAHRAAIIAVCSGSVLLLGFLLMFWRARFRAIWIAAACLGLLGSTLAHTSVLVLGIQSALSGVILTLLGLLIQRLIERSRLAGGPAIAPSPSGSGLVSVAGPQQGADGVGSDDSTAVRARVSSTMDYSPQSLGLSPLSDSARSSRVGRPG